MKNASQEYYEEPLFHPNFPIKISKRSEKKGDFPEKTYYSHRHEELEISMLSEGSCKMECNKKIYRLYKNNILIINPFDVHRRILGDEKIENIQLIISKDFVGYDFTNVVFETFIKNDKHIAQFLYDVLEEYRLRNFGFELRIQGTVCHLLAYLMVNKTVKILGKSIYERKSLNSERIQKVLIYINENINTKLTIDKLSKLINVSPPYFCQIFKEATSRSPIDYINIRRLLNAKALLEDSNLSINEIAQKAGFSDANFFSKLFKKNFHLSPKQYQKTLSFSNSKFI